MGEATIIGIDLAKRSFQVHEAKADGSVAYHRKLNRGKLNRGKLLSFLTSQPSCTVAMEASASAHYWGREITAVVQHASRRGEITDPWLAGMLARKPKKLVAVALANKTARKVWALTTRKETYRVRAAA